MIYSKNDLKYTDNNFKLNEVRIYDRDGNLKETVIAKRIETFEHPIANATRRLKEEKKARKLASLKTKK